MPFRKPLLGELLDYSDPLTKGLDGYWPFNEGSGSKVFDLSGNGNIGTRSAATSWVSGKFGSAINIPGAGNYIDVELDMSSSHSFILWIKTSADGRLFDAQTGRTIFDISGGFIRYYDGSWHSDNTTTVTDGLWHQVAATVEGGTALSLIADGKVVKTDTVTANAISSADPMLFFTHYGQESAHFTGTCDHILAYDPAITPQEIALLYREPFRFVSGARRRSFYAFPEIAAAVVTKPYYYREIASRRIA